MTLNRYINLFFDLRRIILHLVRHLFCHFDFFDCSNLSHIRESISLTCKGLDLAKFFRIWEDFVSESQLANLFLITVLHDIHKVQSWFDNILAELELDLLSLLEWTRFLDFARLAVAFIQDRGVMRTLVGWKFNSLGYVASSGYLIRHGPLYSRVVACEAKVTFLSGKNMQVDSLVCLCVFGLMNGPLETSAVCLWRARDWTCDLDMKLIRVLASRTNIWDSWLHIVQSRSSLRYVFQSIISLWSFTNWHFGLQSVVISSLWWDWRAIFFTWKIGVILLNRFPSLLWISGWRCNSYYTGHFALVRDLL